MISKVILLSFGQCCVCGRLVPDGHLILMHDNGRIICLICITEIAEVPIDD